MSRRYNFRTFNRTRKRYGVRFNSKKGHEFLIVMGVIFVGALINYFWQILIFASLIFTIYLYEKWSKKQVIRKSGINTIDGMEGIEFEERLEILLSDLGYKVKRTPINDFGADLIIDKYKGMRTVVQAKRYNKPVGLKAIQEVIGSMAYYNACHAIVVTNQSFTRQAEQLALKNKVELWERDKLISMLCSPKKKSESELIMDIT
ncbi:restriction endonuclease [Desulfosporosinus hippei]|uniref:Restriction system protein/holliday junction resolvase and Mrr family protein n=1 Tax=Desulfosporosinus hippei DSM 8344 TaxID=1121419 RepID=A0A1G8L3E3_9FIRM|nr:restriction endonuclease [Desulfosporosinus hippei]SDI50212.1 restriction system protein/holliday junction resolvase and Mrr family protein [Desulfosporosinus hippei DSM 8344]